MMRFIIPIIYTVYFYLIILFYLKKLQAKKITKNEIKEEQYLTQKDRS
jgi:hypothetical protein